MTNFEVKEITEENQLHSLKEDLKRNWTCNFLIYGAIDLRLRKGLLKTAKLRVFQAVEPKYKTFVFITPIVSDINLQTMSVIWNPKEVDDESAGRILSYIPDWNWSKEFVFMSCSGDLKQIFQELMKNGIITEHSARSMKQVYPVERGTAFMIAKEDIKIPKLPLAYEEGTLTSSAIPQLLSTWDYQFGETAEGLKERLESYEGRAIFYKNPEGEERTLVAWTQQYMFGAIGMTFTLPEHRRKGLGAAVTLMFANQIVEDGGTAFLTVSEKNRNNIKFHSNLGFKPFGETGLLVYVPEGRSFEDLLKKRHT